MDRFPISIVLGGVLALCAWENLHAQSPFDSPPIPAETTAPAGPAGVAGAPAATFVAPGGVAANGSAAAGDGAADEGAGGVETTRLSEAKPIVGSEIVARVEDQVILASDVMWQVNQMIVMNTLASGRQVPPAQLPQLQEMLMRRMVVQLVDTKLLWADFRRNVPTEALENVNKTLGEPFESAEIPKLLEMYKVQDRAELEAALRKSGATLKDVQEQYVERNVAGQWLREKMPKPKPVSHEEMLAYYQDHLKEYEYPAQARWEELMVRFDRVEGDRDAAWQTLANMANEVWNAVVANPGLRGPVFAEIAKAKSHGFTAADGGVHDWTTLGSLKCEELNQALATLELGQLSRGIESEYGFHIVRVLERKAAGRTPFTEAQSKIRETLETEQKEALLTAELQEIRKKARVWTKWDGDLTGERLAEALGGKQKR